MDPLHDDTSVIEPPGPGNNASSDLPASRDPPRNMHVPAREKKLSSASSSASAKSRARPPSVQLPLAQPAPDHLLTAYPDLALRPYAPRADARPPNVLALLHNALKRELLDVHKVLLPYLRHTTKRVGASPRAAPRDDDNDDGFGDGARARAVDEDFGPVPLTALRTWWGTVLRLAFFVAENDDNITSLVVEPAAKAATRRQDHHAAAALRVRQKSLADRYNFAMEHVFRAADGSLRTHLETPCTETLARTEAKIGALGSFMLAAMAAADELVASIEAECEVDVVALEASVVDGITAFSGKRRPVFMFMCCRWMVDEDAIRAWVTQYGGFRARWSYDSWRKTYFEEHADVLEAMVEALES